MTFVRALLERRKNRRADLASFLPSLHDDQINLGPGILPRFMVDGRTKMSLRDIVKELKRIYCESL